jgi:hypothetical protein
MRGFGTLTQRDAWLLQRISIVSAETPWRSNEDSRPNIDDDRVIRSTPWFRCRAVQPLRGLVFAVGRAVRGSSGQWCLG